MRKALKKTIICLLLVLVMTSVIAGEAIQPVTASTGTQSSSSGQLDILRTDMTLSQDQVMSQIKAEYLLQNNGYKDTDEVVVILSLQDNALIDSYNSTYYAVNSSVGEYASSPEGLAQAEMLEQKQSTLIASLLADGLIESVEHTYTTIMNGIAVTMKYGNISKVEKNAMVKSVILSDTYNLPQSTSSDDTSTIVNDVDVYETGIFNSSSVSYTGIRTAVAILDSGFDCSHSAFQQQPEGELLITQDTITNFLAGAYGQSNAVKFTSNLKLSDVYYSDKIPFAYDYADKDSDVNPYDSEHGTHVAGIIGGSDSTITGVAVNTQLVLMKVFPDLDEGAQTEDILAALEDAVLLQVDAINMSLGSSCGFTREVDREEINEVYDKIYAAGISLLTAASNSYSSGYGGDQGNTNLVTNPDSGTVGSPSTYDAALSVASISGTKSKYIKATDTNGSNSNTFFYLESNAINGDANDFMKELYSLLRTNYPEKYGNLQDGDTVELEYVTVPGVGLRVNYSTIDVKGKIALIRRGDNTFEEKAQIAKSQGAIACIIYNNIDGDIYMSMGNTEHIPTISISKDDGTILAQRKTGKMIISGSYQAGPFMSDFSSWGPTPSLTLKPEITAHGGNIYSSVPGGGYDTLSGTSMATPNLCGIVVLIRQYIKDNYPDLSMKETAILANQLLMSSATIILNQEGNPYSPRKQGAGLASLYNAVNTKAYITVDGSDRTKLELGDDPDRTGVYTMEFNVTNLSNQAVSYSLDFVAMTESVSTSDSTHVAEKANLLSTNYVATVNGQAVSKVTVAANSSVKVTLVYTLSDEDKQEIDNLFPYGMYVEGFVKLIADYTYTTEENGQSVSKNGIDLNIPFLAFYGDWTEAPMFDTTYYEVESESHDQAIDDEDKIKADYYATTPYGSYYYNYIIPLGTYLYDVDTSKYDEIPASEEHIAISNVLGTIDGISTVYAGLLRNAKTMTFTITDKVTGEVIYETVDYNATKAYSTGASIIPYYNFLKLKSSTLGLINNRQYEFKMVGLLDYGDGGINTNVRNSFSFDFYLDDEAPVIKEVTYDKVYDKTLKKDRYYINLTVYDNQYVQSITPLIFTPDGSSVSYTTLTDNPIPVYGERGEETTVRFEITDYLNDISFDALITNGLAFSIDDYALNSNIYVCQLPGTKGDFQFTKDGTTESSGMTILSLYAGEVVDLTKYLATSDSTVDADKDYLKYLSWESSDESVAIVKDGLVQCLKKGRATITVTELMEGKKANLIVNIKAPNGEVSDNVVTNDVSSVTLQSLRFAYFDTLFAYSRAAQTSEIGSTGSRLFLSSMSNISFYPGESVQLFYDIEPWYSADNYEFEYSTTNATVATVDENGVVKALKKGSATITLKAKNKATGVTSNIMASVRLEVKSEFVIESRTLIAYKGLGGDVVIPDDEGILYIGSFAFCLYTTDYSIELSDDDYDANKIPAANTTITSVVIPYGVEEIQKYAFYNCSGLEEVQIPSSCKYIREYAFYNDEKLASIKLTGSEDVGLEGTKVETIGKLAFYNCTSLEEINLSKVLALGVRAFDGCSALKSVDLSALRNSGEETFRDCTSLESVVLNENTKLSQAMFARSGLKSVDIYEKVSIPAYCFAKCANLETVNIHNSLVSIGEGAFSDCSSLTAFNLNGETITTLDEQSFYNCSALESFTLPNCSVSLGSYSFLNSGLTTLVFGDKTVISNIEGSVFDGTKLSTFEVASGNTHYSADTENGLLLSADGNTVILAAVGKDYSENELVLNYQNIGDGAFSGTNVTTVTFANATNIGAYAFANCTGLTTINFADAQGTVIGESAFYSTTALTDANNLDKVTTIGEYAFAGSNLRTAVLGDNTTIGNGAFYMSKLVNVTIGANSTFGVGAFRQCSYLTTVTMPENGGVVFSNMSFALDTSLATIDLSKVEIIPDECFYGCTSLTTATLTSAKKIGEYAFADCENIRYLSLPVVESIGDGAFSRNSSSGSAPAVSSVILPETLVSLGTGAFLGCQGITEFQFPSTLTKVPDYLLSYASSLVEITLPDSVTEIGAGAFYGCEAMTTINLGRVKTIGDYAFKNAYLLETVDFSSVETIGDEAFMNAGLDGSISAPKLVKVGSSAFENGYIDSFSAPLLQSIGSGAFVQNNLTEFVLSSDLSYVGQLAFFNCSKLTDFKFVGSNGLTNSGTINNFAKLEDGVLYTAMASGNMQLTSVPAAKNVKTLTVAEGTYRIDYYAGNANKNITTIVLPDTLKLIGNYAFYGYDKLATVEFRSYTAPALESSYISSASLSTTDPGYDALHATYDLYGLELYYYTFVDLVGKTKPLSIVLPANNSVDGYNSLVYSVYFDVANATRSDYVARDKNLVSFYEYAQKVAQLNAITMMSETVINKAVTALNAIPADQDPTTYGYSAEEWAELVKVVKEAKETLRLLQLSNASKAAQQLQVEISNLSTTFSVENLETLNDIATRLSKLESSERVLLDLTNYTALQTQLANYNATVKADMQGVRQVVDNSYSVSAVAAALAASLSAVVVAILLKRRGI